MIPPNPAANWALRNRIVDIAEDLATGSPRDLEIARKLLDAVRETRESGRPHDTSRDVKLG